MGLSPLVPTPAEMVTSAVRGNGIDPAEPWYISTRTEFDRRVGYR